MTCAHLRKYKDPVSVVGYPGVNKKQIGYAPRCEACQILGDFRPDRGFQDDLLAKLQAKLTQPIWNLMIEKNMKSPGCPLNFEVLPDGRLRPENYQQDQVEMDETPF